MIADAKTDEVGLDVVGGEGESGKQVVGEIVAHRHLLVEQEGLGEQRLVVAQAGVEHETDAVEHHLIRNQQTDLRFPVGMGDFAAVVDDHLRAKAQTVALGELEHEVGGQVVNEKVLVCAILLAHVLESQCVLVVGDEMPFAVELEKVVLWAQLFVNLSLGWCQTPRKPCGHAENVDAHVGRAGGAVREVGQAYGSHPVQAFDNALPVFEREVDGCIDVRPDGIVVEVLLRVELVGEERHAHAQLEGQFAVFVGRDGEVDERIEGKHLAQLGGNAVVAEAGVIESEARGRVVVQHFPTMLAVCVAVERQLVGRRVAAVTS